VPAVAVRQIARVLFRLIGRKRFLGRRFNFVKNARDIIVDVYFLFFAAMKSCDGVKKFKPHR